MHMKNIFYDTPMFDKFHDIDSWTEVQFATKQSWERYDFYTNIRQSPYQPVWLFKRPTSLLAQAS
jgi:hypothetical protein